MKFFQPSNILKEDKIIEWEITSKCNFSCFYCELKKNKIVTDENKLKEFIKNLKDEIQDKELFISGGEPFTHPKIAFIINELNKNNINFVIQTNFSNISYEKLKQFSDLKINISVHSEFKKFLSLKELLLRLLTIKKKHNIKNITVMYSEYEMLEVFKKIKFLFKQTKISPITGLDFKYFKTACKKLEEFLKLIENNKINRKDVEDIYYQLDNHKISRLELWRMQCLKQFSPKGKPCLFPNYVLYLADLSKTNCCYGKIHSTVCQQQTCFFM